MQITKTLLAASLLSASAALADTWSFEVPATPNGGYAQYGVGGVIEGWTVGGPCGGNCVLAINTNYQEGGPLNFVAHDGTTSLDLTGAGNTGFNSITQSFNLVAGRTYELSFWLGDINGGNGNYLLPATLGVSINGGPLALFSNAGGTATQTWAGYTHTFTAGAGATTISFINQTTGDNLVGLDSVSLNTVPEPVGFTALSAGAIGLLVTAVRRRR